MNGLRLVATAPTPALRRAVFGGDDDLDPGGRNAAAALRPAFTRATGWACAPTAAARQTTAALGGTHPDVTDALADPDHGTWTGRTLDQIAADDPTGLHAWLTDPRAAPHGGEPLTAVRDRAGTWLDAHAGHTLVAVAHPAVVRCALAHALRLPPDGIWQLDVAPLAVLRLTSRTGRWHLHLPG